MTFRTHISECWNWIGCRSYKGYGWTPNAKYAHRMVFELANGPIPQNTVVHHMCRNRLCVRPSHLELVSRGENVRIANLEDSAWKDWFAIEGNLYDMEK